MSKSKPKGEDAKPRYIPPGSCTWCGHKPHAEACSKTIRVTLKGDTGPCPCIRHTLRPASDFDVTVGELNARDT